MAHTPAPVRTKTRSVGEMVSMGEVYADQFNSQRELMSSQANGSRTDCD